MSGVQSRDGLNGLDGLDGVRRIADAVLYEGYILYPYRASAQKNRSRWQFGVLMPPSYADASENSVLRAECVFSHPDVPAVEVLVRFLQVQRRTGPGADVWDEAVSREVAAGAGGDELFGDGIVAPFEVPGGEEHAASSGAGTEASSGTDTATGSEAGATASSEAGTGAGATASSEASPASASVVRRRERLSGTVSVRATRLPGPWQAARLTVEVTNRTASRSAAAPESRSAADSRSAASPSRGRDEALPYALVAAHMIIRVPGGAFASMTDPPEWAAASVGACVNTGCWPVLAGPAGTRDVLLAAPIILPDHPEVAPESPGELYDGTEIDEILTLRTLALTDEEKQAARATDSRAAALIDRVESLDGAALERMHGTMRGASRQDGPRQDGPRQDGPRLGGEPPGDVPWWDPAADASVSPGTDSVLVGGRQVARGSRVTLRPGTVKPDGRRADAQDMFLAGRPAVVEAVLLDVEDRPYLAVSLEDDPAADLHAAHGRFLYFAPEEVEPC